MTKLEKDALISKISEKVDNEDLAIELMEDITDSFPSDAENVNLRSELEKKNQEYEDLKTKYKERFLESKPSSNEDPIKELEVKNYYDLKEI